MTPILFAIESCGDAIEAAAAIAAVRAQGATAEIAWFGPAARLDDAVALGLPQPVHAYAPDAGVGEARAELARFVSQLLARPWRAVVTVGHGPLAVALGHAALAVHVPVARLVAGLRTHAPRDERDAARRAADLAASLWFGDSDARRHELFHDGVDIARLQATGSLLAEALASRLPRIADAVVVAWERPLEALVALDRLCAIAAAVAPRAVRVLPTRGAAGLPAMRGELPANVELAPADGPVAQLDELLAAAAIATDSVGHQRLAMAAGAPCVVAAADGVLADALAHGVVHVAGDAGAELGAACARALHGPRPARLDAAGAAARFATALLAATTGDGLPARVLLPSDGDCTGRTLGAAEAILAADAIRRGTLNSTRGVYVATLEKRFAAWLGRKHAIACASGSAAMHCAIAALRLQAGDEVVTTPITDMGALTPILYEGGVPVFADVDPATLNVTAATIAAQLTPRTRAIVVTHLFGRPADLDAIVALAHARGLPLVEDAAQGFGATWRGRKVGCHGAIAAFSLQQGKHITTGEGGIVVTDDDELARRVFLFVNKAWGYGDKKPDHYFPALNYRMTELQGAVATAQLPRLDAVVQARRQVAAALRAGLADVPGLALPDDPAHGEHAWWKFAFRVDAEAVPGGAVALGQRMQQAGVACVPRYVQKPAFECELFRDWSRSPITSLPLAQNPRARGAQPLFRREDYPGAIRGLEQVVVLPINERYEHKHVDHVCAAIRAGVGALQHA